MSTKSLDIPTVMGALLVVAFSMASMTAIPFLFIWSLNILFGMGIQYTFSNLIAGFVLLLIVSMITRIKV